MTRQTEDGEPELAALAWLSRRHATLMPGACAAPESRRGVAL